MTQGSVAIDPQTLVDSARRRRRRLVALTAAASVAAVLAVGGVGVGLAMTLDDAPVPPAATPTPPSPTRTESTLGAPTDPVTGTVGANACGRPLDELPWRADDRVSLGSDTGPRLDGAALAIDTWILSREGNWMIAQDLDAVVLDSSGRVVAYLTAATTNESAAGLTTGTLLPCDSGTDTLRPGPYTFVAAMAFVEVTSSYQQQVGATPAHAVASWDLVVSPEHAGTP